MLVNVDLRNQFIETGRVFAGTSSSVEEHIETVTRLREGYAKLAEASRDLRELKTAQEELTVSIQDTGDTLNAALAKGADPINAYRTGLKSLRQEATSALTEINK